MGMGMSMGLSLKQALTQKILVSMPSIQWSLVNAYNNGQTGPPTFEEEVFEPRLKLEQRTIDFQDSDHIKRMKMVDEANEIFRFAYTRGSDERTGDEKGYYKIPLMRNHNVEINDIKVRISKADYVLATSILQAVGEMERIARAIPYHGLYKTVAKHLKQFGLGADKTVLISVDRGGRIPCIVLMHALGHPTMETLKVDQGGGRLDEDRLLEFVRQHTLVDKHVLFVDSTVDSGRQIRVLEHYFESSEWKAKLQYRSWSIVGSNEYGENLSHHCNINWGVDPDTTFEDDPNLMGVDYASGTQTKVVECPGEASEAIRKCLLSVPAGIIYDADDIVEQINGQYREWNKHQAGRRKTHEASVVTAKADHDQEVETYRKEKAEQKFRDGVEREWSHITATKRWKDAVTQTPTISFEHLPTSIPNGTTHNLHNILVIGNGRQVDLPSHASDLIADTLGPYHSFFAGTPDGNPGTILKNVLKRVTQPEVRLYQPGYREGKMDDSFGGVPVVFRGPEKEEMRQQMVQDSHIALVLGGAEGTLREVLIALKLGKPAVVIKGWGAIPTYLLGSRKYNKLPQLKVCNDVADAVQTIMEMTKT